MGSAAVLKLIVFVVIDLGLGVGRRCGLTGLMYCCSSSLRCLLDASQDAVGFLTAPEFTGVLL